MNTYYFRVIVTRQSTGTAVRLLLVQVSFESRRTVIEQLASEIASQWPMHWDVDVRNIARHEYDIEIALVQSC